MPELDASLDLPTAQRPQALIVDDEPVVRKVVRRALQRAGFDVTEASDGRAALDCARGSDFDLVISDVRMPVMDGLDLLEHLSLHLPELPVILISGSLESAGIRRATALGAFDVLDKPFAVQRLQSAALRALDRRNKETPRSPDRGSRLPTRASPQTLQDSRAVGRVAIGPTLDELGDGHHG